jgi:hypothetical protein
MADEIPSVGRFEDAHGQHAKSGQTLGFVACYADVPGDWNDLARDSSDAQKGESASSRRSFKSRSQSSSCPRSRPTATSARRASSWGA